MHIFRIAIVYFYLLPLVNMHVYCQVNLQHTFQEKKHMPVCTAYSSDGKYLASGGTDKRILIWSLSNEALYKRLEGLKDFPLDVVFDRNNKLLISGGKDGLITIWNLGTATKQGVLSEHQGNVLSVDVSPDNRNIVSGSMDKTIRVWDLKTGTNTRTLTGHTHQVNSVCYSHDGKTILSAGADQQIIEWDTQNGSIIRILNQAHDDWIRKALYSPDGKYIVSCSDDRFIKIWNRKTGEIINTIRAHQDDVFTFSFSPDGKYLVSGGHDKRLVIIEVESGRIAFQSPQQKNYILSARFAPDGQSLAAAVLYSNELAIWDTRQLHITPDAVSRAQEELVKQELPVKAPEMRCIAPDPSVQTTTRSVLPTHLEIEAEGGFRKITVEINGKEFTSYQEDDLRPGTNGISHIKRNLFLSPGKNTITYTLHGYDGNILRKKRELHYTPIKQPELIWGSGMNPKMQTTDPVFQIRSQIESVSTLKSVALYNNDEIIFAKHNVYMRPDSNQVQFNPLITLKEGINQLKLTATNEGGLGESSLLTISYTPPQKEIEIIIPPAKPNPYRFALIIGNEDYSSYQVGLESESDVAYAKNDAIEFRKYAIKYLGVPEDQAIIKLNARYIEMKREIKKMKGIMAITGGKAEFFFYYAGHGFPHEKTKDPYLIPVDGSGTDLEFSAISLNELYTDLTTHPSQRVTVFLDACFSGGGRNKGINEARGVKIKPQSANMRNNLVVFSAASESQTSLPYRDKEHGIFTYFILQKIDETGGFVTYKELSEYVTEQVGIKSYLINSKKQVPEVHASPEIGGVWQDWSLR